MIAENTLKALINAIPDIVLRISDGGDFLECKASDETDLFAPILEIIGSNVNDIFDDNLAEQYFYYIKKALETDQVQICEYKQKLVKGDKNFEARFVACDQKEVLVIVRNITKRKDAEDKLIQMILQLEESQDNLVTILNQMSLGSAITDESGKLNFVSQSALDLLRLKESDYLNKRWKDVFPLSERALDDLYEALKLSPKVRTKTLVRIPSKDGDQWIDFEIKDHPNSPHKKIFFFHDMTEVYQLRRLLKDKTPFKGMIGNSSAMRRVYQQINEVAPVDITVLIQGETGTGKELVARAIHQASSRHERPFIAVNCAGLMTDSLLGSQLFGHKKGAFTGAIEDHKGLLEQANGGTLFLDEIGDMPLAVQSQLLRFLQEKEITRIGDSKIRKLNVRILAASQHDLDGEVKNGNFRLDLLYRIRVASIILPPLRDRREDIPLLASWFLRKHAKEQGKEIQQVSSDAMQVLITHFWPGNVRELEGVIGIAAIRCQGTFINTADLPLSEIMSRSTGYEFNPDKKLSRRERILKVLDETHGNKSKAAKLLGMSRSTLYRKMGELGIEIQVD